MSDEKITKQEIIRQIVLCIPKEYWKCFPSIIYTEIAKQAARVK